MNVTVAAWRMRRLSASRLLVVAEEELEVDVLGLDAVLDQRVADQRHQLDRPAQEPLVDRRRGASVAAQPALELLAVDATAELGDVSRVAGEHVEDLEPVGVARLELVELVAEHRRLSCVRLP